MMNAVDKDGGDFPLAVHVYDSVDLALLEHDFRLRITFIKSWSQIMFILLWK